jgi:hypothetical protein
MVQESRAQGKVLGSVQWVVSGSGQFQWPVSEVSGQLQSQW